MTEYKVHEIHIDKLLLDTRNPRHNILSDQTETLQEIILDQKGKLVKLTQDITQYGINPSDLTIAIPSDDDSAKFIVLEGNRRLAALKLLVDPTIAALGCDTRTVNTLKSYSARYYENPIKSLRCVVFKKREDANHWIELRHTGENEGRGVVGWKAKEKARFNELLGKRSSALQVLEFVRKNAALDNEELESLKQPNISSIQRLISDPYVREIMGIDMTDGYITSSFPPEEVINGLTKLVMDIATKRRSVDDIRHKSDRVDYMSEFNEGDLPDVNANLVFTWQLQSQTGPVRPRVSTSTKTSDAEAEKKSVPLSITRKTLIPSSCVLRIKKMPRINKIYRELKGLEVDGFENACAITFRVFLELSVEEFLKTKHITFHENDSLANKIKEAARYFESNKLMSKDELKPVRVAWSSPDNLVSTHTLNAYVHNPNIAPKSKELKLTWDSFEKFFKTLWP